MLSLADSHDNVPAKKIMLKTLIILVIRNALIFLTSVTGNTMATDMAMYIQRFFSKQYATCPFVSPTAQEQFNRGGNNRVAKSPINTTYPMEAMMTSRRTKILTTLAHLFPYVRSATSW